jgi:leucyl aminopeptidase
MGSDEVVEAVVAAGETAGESQWPMPIPEAMDERIHSSKIADLSNSGSKRKAGTLYAAAYLEQFTEGATWAHLDIAGTAWDVGREYVGKGASGYGVRLLVELARRHAERG